MEQYSSVILDLPNAEDSVIELDGQVAVTVRGDSNGGGPAIVINGLRVDFAPTSLLSLNGEYVVPSFNMMSRLRDAIALLVDEVTRLRQEVEALKSGGAQA